MRYLAVESSVVCKGSNALAQLKHSGATAEELRYADFLVKKLEGRVDKYIDPKWRQNYGYAR